MTGDVRVRVAGADDVDACLAVLGAAYDRQFTREWFEWKHLECPWGASRPYIASDDDEILGVFYSLRWPYRRRDRSGATVDVDGARLVDGATLPAARGRRVLGLLIQDELARWNPDQRPGVLLATATPAAEKSHARSGATTLPPIVSAFGPPRSLRPARLVRDAAVLDTYLPDAPGVVTERLRTAWTPESLRWRIDARTGHDYEVAALANASAPNGVVYRVTRRQGFRTLFPVLIWGEAADQRRLIGAVAVATGSIIVHAPVGPAVDPPHIRPIRTGGTSVMCVWDRRDPSDGTPPATDASSWALALADLEGLV